MYANTYAPQMQWCNHTEMPRKAASHHWLIILIIPMIVTNVGGLPALVPEGKVGLIAEPTPESLADKMEEFCKPGLLLSSPFSMKEKYSWPVMVDAIIGSVT